MSNGGATWRDFYELGKPRVVALIVFTAVVGMFLAVPGMPPWDKLLFGTLGIGLAASAAAAVNRLISCIRSAMRPVTIMVSTAATRPRPLAKGTSL